MGQETRSVVEPRESSGAILPEPLGVMVKGKPFQPRPREPVGQNETRAHSLRKSAAGSQVSKVDWQSEKLSTEQWRFLNHILTQFAEVLAPHLTPVFQLRAVVEVGEVEQQSFKEFLDSFPTPTPMAVLALDEKNKAVYALDSAASFSTLDYLLGGKGETLDDMREFSELEKVLFRNHVLSKIILAHTEAWKEMNSVSPRLEELEFSPNSLVFLPYGDLVLSARFMIRVGMMMGTLSLALPLKYLRGMLPKNAEQFTLYSTTKTPENTPSASPAMGKKIETTALPVSVELGRAEVMFQDLLDLEVGDTIMLSTKRGDPLRIKVADQTKFLGQAGQSAKKMGIRITHIVQEGDENFDE